MNTKPRKATLGAKHLPTIEKLGSLFESEHGSCEDSTCTMSRAYEHGFDLVAIDQWASSGAACEVFKTLVRSLPAKAFSNDVDAQNDEFCETVAHDECEHCNSIVWHATPHCDTFYCDSCNNDTVKNDLRSIILRAACRHETA